MKQIQKRYIYSAILASVFFVVIYGIIRINLIIGIILTVFIYLGGIFLFKKDDLRTLDAESVNNYYYLASRVQSQANLTQNEKMIKTCEGIGKYTDDILVSLSQRPKKVEQVFDFFDYYLDISYKILYKYNFIQKNEDYKDDEFIKNAEENLNKILSEFKKQYKNMQEAKVLDIETEIKMFQQSSGITLENVKVGERNE
ncbi:MAG: 5-bromo-4-chloroindolyl phosphate hydrolysis family protein [Bacilli bacterium]|nr:5-bromo-4-chloroindolyl phosphate hydrolysis family protein [Bacilli bacterium]